MRARQPGNREIDHLSWLALLRALVEQCSAGGRCVAQCAEDEYIVNGMCERGGDSIALDERTVYCISAVDRGTATWARAICAKKLPVTESERCFRATGANSRIWWKSPAGKGETFRALPAFPPWRKGQRHVQSDRWERRQQ